jgi:hypothetical protein
MKSESQRSPGYGSGYTRRHAMTGKILLNRVFGAGTFQPNRTLRRTIPSQPIASLA